MSEETDRIAKQFREAEQNRQHQQVQAVTDAKVASQNFLQHARGAFKEINKLFAEMQKSLLELASQRATVTGNFEQGYLSFNVPSSIRVTPDDGIRPYGNSVELQDPGYTLTVKIEPAAQQLKFQIMDGFTSECRHEEDLRVGEWSRGRVLELLTVVTQLASGSDANPRV
jgi:hypothetical protein